eukprot:2918347-Amphidinium_carterae.1
MYGAITREYHKSNGIANESTIPYRVFLFPCHGIATIGHNLTSCPPRPLELPPGNSEASSNHRNKKESRHKRSNARTSNTYNAAR